MVGLSVLILTHKFFKHIFSPCPVERSLRCYKNRKDVATAEKLTEYFISVWKSEGAFPLTSESLKQSQIEVSVEDVLE